MAVLSFLSYLRGIYKINLNTSSRVHHAIIQSIYDCFVMAKEDIDLSRLEMCLSTATGYWLDCWGEYFSVYRKTDEDDETYSKRIVDSVIKPKSTIPAIKDHIVDYLNSEYNKNYTREDVTILEPWTQVAKYSHKGKLSKDSRFCSGDYYCHAVIDIRIPEEVTKNLIDLVKAVKAAGVKALWTVMNSYDIVSGFDTPDDAWAAYTRHLQTMTKRNQYTGLVLSNSSPNPKLSGTRQTWFITTSLYQWYAKIKEKDTDKSFIITKKDLIGLVDFYKKIESTLELDLDDNLRISEDGKLSTDKSISGSISKVTTLETLVKITNDMIKSLELMDSFLTLSYTGKMSTSEGTMLEHLASHELFNKLMKAVKDFKEINPEYYNSVQPPILNGERAMWLVQRNKNWLWNTPTMTHEDFFELWEPFGEYEEHTINSVVEFEDAYYKGYITFGDHYQPPIVVGKPFYWTPKIMKDWMYNSPVFNNGDLEQLYVRQFYSQGTAVKENPTIGEIMNLEEKFLEQKYSTIGEEQPPIEIKSVPIEANET